MILFFVASSYTIFKNNDIDLGSFDGVLTLAKLYISSAVNVVRNIGKISTFAVKQEWGANSTNLSGVL